ncbi:glycine and tyrosine-rich protein-like isoform X2 [Aricia agestis]|uniref:glycine and tyrosine-rich protein-like isoform X2 n=1 Tax=Aricia agestis TaxID=91739 RepID=UPI001C207746|nr:glycine and tyrosine-rich protein-like isoform X2 [Aricia agestis]
MAKGMLSLTVALLLSAMCAVEGQSAASGAAAAGGGGFGGPASAAAAAASGGGYGGPGYGGGGYGGGGYLPNGYGPQYVYNPYPNTFLPRRTTSSYVFAPTDSKKRNGLGFISDILNHAIKLNALNNSNGAPNPANKYS